MRKERLSAFSFRVAEGPQFNIIIRRYSREDFEVVGENTREGSMAADQR